MNVWSTAPEPPSTTLTLGVDRSGRVIQCGNGTLGVLGRAPDETLGTHLAELFVGSDDGQEALSALVDAVHSERERTAMLVIEGKDGSTTDAVVSVQPMRASQGDLAALVVIRVAMLTEQRFLDPAFMRRMLLDEALVRVGAALDIDQTARELVDVVVPYFCNAAGLLLLESVVGEDELPTHPPDRSARVRRLAVAADDGDPSWFSTFPTGEILSYPAETPYTRCMESGKPVSVRFDDSTAAAMADSWQRGPVATLLAGASMVVLPLIARDTTLGIIVCTRKEGYRRFDAYDVEIATEFAARAAIFIDNARRYSRERTTALTLQRSLLPTSLSAPPGVEVGHRYLPGSQLIEVGGDWYESISLPGARVALIVGDVAGHGVRAAVTMGQLRTALRTLVNLELPPAEALEQLDELMHALGQREPHFATCTYAVYDAVSGVCEVASAGHPPPLLVRPDGTGELLDIAPAPPLGIGGDPIESQKFAIDDGSLFVLYTDGLVESRDRDIEDGLRRLRRVFDSESTSRSLEDLCKAALDGVYSEHQRDDIALIIARLRRLPADRHVCGTLPAEPAEVPRARALARAALERWGLATLSDTTELLVSELVTNAIRYSTGEVTVRLLYEQNLVCEVSDTSPVVPARQLMEDDDEHGRGLQVVSRLAARWGTRRTPLGKIVWCEQPLPAPNLLGRDLAETQRDVSDA
ncbi:MAG: SpoIIE family protein phosphatase [Streptosporangiales bacterium]|nr:SpoIIE family protein phosphatase [Streptosporangiales bacterium]